MAVAPTMVMLLVILLVSQILITHWIS